MSEAFMSEIKIVAFNFPPKGWAFCNGQLLPINQNQALFSLYGTTFGGNGQTTFALPNLQGRVAIHDDDAYRQGQQSGEATHTLTSPELPQHTHPVVADTAQGTTAPSSTTRLAASSGGTFYAGATNLVAMAT